MPVEVRELCREVDVIGDIEQMIGTALTGVDDCPITPEKWSLSTGDLAPHNVLVDERGSIRVLDLEYSGWDDPLIPCADFLSAESCIGLSEACGEKFLETYRKKAGLTPAEVHRLRRVRALMEIGWVAVHLSLFLPQRIAPKRFADADFDVDAHLTERVQRVRARLARARQVVPSVLGVSESLT